MLFLTSCELDNIISEDLPLFDITTELLELKGIGKISIYSRQHGILCGTEEVEKLFIKLDISTSYLKQSGSKIQPSDLIIEGVGEVRKLHIAWKISANMLEYMSGIATHTCNFVSKAKQINPNVCIASTRKYPPFTKKLVMKAIIVGGAVPHRVSLSDTVLIFKQHMEFKPFDEIINQLNNFKLKLGNKQIGIEVESKEQAIKALTAGFDFIQLDKMKIDEIIEIVKFRNENKTPAKIAIAGGITMDNIEVYASTGADIIVTSSLYWAKPLDFKVDFVKL